MTKKNKQAKKNGNERIELMSLSKIARNPFPREWRTAITWSPPTVLFTPGASSSAFVIRLNDLFDPDYSNVFGNGQPLYTDQVISATGPYQRFRVDSWKVRVDLVNVSANTSGGTASALDIYLMQGANNATDVDTFSELQSSPGVMTDLLSTPGSTQAYKQWNLAGRVVDYVPKATAHEDDYCGDYATSPTKPLYLGVGYKNADPTDAGAVKLYGKIVVEYNVVFFARDAISS